LDLTLRAYGKGHGRIRFTARFNSRCANTIMPAEFRIQGSGCRVQGSGANTQFDLVWGSEPKVQSAGLRASELGFRVEGFKGEILRFMVNCASGQHRIRAVARAKKRG